MNSKLGFLALALVTACSAIACGGDDDVEPGDNSSGGLASSSSSGDVTSSSSSSSGSVTSSSSSGSVTSSSSSGGSSGTVSLCPAAPTEYPGADTFATTAAAGLAIRGQLRALNTAMQTAEASGGATVESLNTLYNASGAPMVPSLSRLASQSRKDVVATTFASFVAAQGKTFAPVGPNESGGKFGTWLFDVRGLDLRQMIEKGSFGAELFRGFSTQDPRPLTGRVDEIVALFGTNPTFHGVSTPPDAAIDDVHVARYAFNRDAAGLYATFKTNAILAKHASANIADCQAEFDGAIAALKKTWEETLAATTINYLHVTAPKLVSASATAVPEGLHGLGEATGFLYGLASLAPADRIITDAALASVFTSLRIEAEADGEFSPKAFATGAQDPTIPFNDAINALKAAYGFTDAQITTFKGN